MSTDRPGAAADAHRAAGGRCRRARGARRAGRRRGVRAGAARSSLAGHRSCRPRHRGSPGRRPRGARRRRRHARQAAARARASSWSWSGAVRSSGGSAPAGPQRAPWVFLAAGVVGFLVAWDGMTADLAPLLLVVGVGVTVASLVWNRLVPAPDPGSPAYADGAVERRTVLRAAAVVGGLAVVGVGVVALDPTRLDRGGRRRPLDAADAGAHRPGAPAAARHHAGGARHRAGDHAERGLLPDRRLAHPARGGGRRLVADHRRHGRLARARSPTPTCRRCPASSATSRSPA